ncbi:trypsin-like peptidase domain-containing protein [Ottowia sp.]|uniref:trypsin-like peptidase domain-containing protein n=1 Tax=Ottowia sp. TaxID=1898956 RepID=UPI003A8AF464
MVFSAITLAACGGGDGATAISVSSAPVATAAVTKLGMLESVEAVDTKLVQIQKVAQKVADRVAPRTITLEPLSGLKAAPITAAQPGQPQQIGVARSVAQAADSAATAAQLSWSGAADGHQRAAISVQSPAAKGLRLGLRIEQLPPGTLLRVYAPNAEQVVEVASAEVLRAIQRNLDAGATGDAAYTYWLPTVEGAEAVLEFDLAAGTDPALLKVALPQVSHLKALPVDAEMQLKDAGACNVDVTCTSSTETLRRAVALMYFVNGGDGYVCTGTLLNNTKEDGTPYFLSANHCISSQTVATSLETYWNYRSSSCNGSTRDSRFQILTGGATLLHAAESTDTSFMRLNASPNNPIFAGWDASAVVATGSSVFSIHHPDGDWQKYSLGGVVAYSSCDDEGYCNDVSSSRGQFYRTVWTQGVTEGGSSGGALFASDGSVIGQLLGGTASCANPGGWDVYGRLDLAYSALSQWLSPAISTEPGTLSPVYRFYNSVTSAHFYTNSALERDYVISTLPTYSYEGISYRAYNGTAANASPVYRFYNTETGVHFYTISAAERDNVINTMPVYTYEGPTWYAQTASGSGASALYRFYSAQRRAHFYTMSEGERDYVIATYPDFDYEGTAYYAWPAQ